ncbi:MAG: chemotaxis protein CheA [Planctomycetes bacterium]|nr:chemotaxis protein CheA [Planctomycetota bacterium]
MTKNDNTHRNVHQLIEQLSQAAQAVASNDLSLLAKMHSWCEALFATDSESESPLSDQARQLAAQLENLILGEADDPAAAISFVKNGIEALGGKDANPEPPPAGSQAAGPIVESRGSADSTAPAEESEPIANETDNANEQPPSPPEKTEQETQSAPSDATIEAYEQIPLEINENELEFIKGFLEEAGEHIEAIEAALLDVEREPDNSTNIDNLFRPFHTIKGMAGFLNLRDINGLTHEAETIMDQARKGNRKITPGLIDLVFDVVDILKAQLGEIASYMADPQGNVIPQPPIGEMIRKLRGVIAGRIELEGREPMAGNADNKVGENLVEQGAVAKEVVNVALDTQQRTRPGKKTGEILMDMGATTPKQVSQAIRPQTQKKTAAAATGDLSVRIDTAKLDGLVDMVGELVIAQTLVDVTADTLADAKLVKNVNQVGNIVRDVQELAMSMRMIPIGPTFQKMARLVRDVSRKAGKKVRLEISGEETELDKNVIQQIGDPLVHMIRNAADHGIETPEERREIGKPEEGTVHLSAFHHSGNIVIEIADDGKGLDPKKLIAKGIERGIIQEGEEISDQQAYALVFAPGFSMAKQVTDISGRGVGMDVVRRNIEQLRGKVEIKSDLGKGSTFAICLPLTLAIIDGMVIQVGTERFIIPTISIEQALRPRPEQITSVQHKGQVLNVRGRLIPLVSLGELFGLTGPVNPCNAMVVIAQCEGRPMGLIVDDLIGQQQVVIKSLGERFKHLKGIAGAAILGDGKVGLILEMAGLAETHARTHVTHRRATSVVAKPGDERAIADIVEEETVAAGECTQDTADQDEKTLVEV